MKLSRFAAWPLFVVALSAPALVDCSAKDLAAAAQGCNGLDVSAKADMTVKAFADAAASLKAKALEVEALSLIHI